MINCNAGRRAPRPFPLRTPPLLRMVSCHSTLAYMHCQRHIISYPGCQQNRVDDKRGHQTTLHSTTMALGLRRCYCYAHTISLGRNAYQGHRSSCPALEKLSIPLCETAVRDRRGAQIRSPELLVAMTWVSPIFEDAGWCIDMGQEGLRS